MTQEQVLNPRDYDEQDYWHFLQSIAAVTPVEKKKPLNDLVMRANNDGLTDERKKRILELAVESGIQLTPKPKPAVGSPTNAKKRGGAKSEDGLKEKLDEPPFNERVVAAARELGPEALAAVTESSEPDEDDEEEVNDTAPAITPTSPPPAPPVQVFQAPAPEPEPPPPTLTSVQLVKIASGQGMRVQCSAQTGEIVLDRSLTRREHADLFASFVSIQAPHLDEAAILSSVAQHPELPAAAKLAGKAVYFAQWSNKMDGFVTKRAYDAWAVHAPAVSAPTVSTTGTTTAQPAAKVQAAERGDGLTWSDGDGEIRKVSTAILIIASGQPFEIVRNAEVKKRKYNGPSVGVESIATARGLVKTWIDLAQDPNFDSRRFAEFLKPLAAQL